MNQKPVSPLRLGVAGLGTVGATVVQSLLAGAIDHVVVTRVSARTPDKDRGFDMAGIAFEADPLDLVSADDVDVVVELVGGQDGPALALVQAAMQAGKPLVTANKALLATHAADLSDLSLGEGGAEGGVVLAYEAAVAGGIPIIKTLREGLAGNHISQIAGILNGTCNYILTRMEAAGLSFEAALQEAQDKGFAEADPELDISGVDAAQKLSLLSALAFDLAPDFTEIAVQGVEQISAQDIAFAGQFDYVIRLIGMSVRDGAKVFQRVTPMLVKKGSALSEVTNELNGIEVTSKPLGKLFLQGAGAGGGATASAVLADIGDLARGGGLPLFDGKVSQMAARASHQAPESEYYLRLGLIDKPGSMAKATQILAENGVSIEEVVQRASNDGDDYLPVVFITHEVNESELNTALKALQSAQDICSGVMSLPIFAD
jgi:homoserine dehydrogenase